MTTEQENSGGEGEVGGRGTADVDDVVQYLLLPPRRVRDNHSLFTAVNTQPQNYLSTCKMLLEIVIIISIGYSKE
jgi:hypothetical protein